MGSRIGILAMRMGSGIAMLILASGQASRGRVAQVPERRLLCDVEVPRVSKPALPAKSLDDVCSALAACWPVPADLGKSRTLEITVRFILGENGLIAGAPRPTYAAGISNAEARASLVRGTIDSIRRCMPVMRTPALESTMVVNDIALHLVYRQAKH